LLQARKPNAPVEWMQKLPQMARRLEESLFRSAQSFDEYKDTQTLKKRLQALAIAMGLRAQQQKQKNEEHGPIHTGSDMNSSHAPETSGRDTNTSNVMSGVGTDSGLSTSSHPGGEISANASIPNNRLVSLSDINPLMGLSSAEGNMDTSTVKGDTEMNSAVNASAALATRSSSTICTTREVSSIQRPYHADQRQQVLRQQQQRLLLLRHASKCPHENGTCPVTPHCAGMKRLWKHIAECKDQQCQMAHCVSSRYVLSHYHRCKDPRCAVCGPVREAIQRNHEKAKQLAMAQHNLGSGVEPHANVRDLSSGLSEGRTSGNVSSHEGSRGGTAGLLRGHAQRNIIGDRARQRHNSTKTARGSQRYGGQNFATGMQEVKRTRIINGITTGTAGIADMHKAEDVPLSAVQAPTGRIEEGTSLLNSFTPSQIHAHLQSLKTGLRLTAAKIRQKCAPVLKKLTDHECSWIFMQPVDPVELNLPDYFDVIKTPMDLGSIKKRMENNCYKSISEFGSDVRLTFDNAISYNGDGSDVCKVAREMKGIFEKLYHAMIASIEAEEEHRKSNGDVCVLCGCEKLLFEPTVYYCNGSCNGQRIRRNSYYYTGGRNQYHWCQQCFNELREKEPLEFADCTLWKKELQKKKNDEMHEEPWVECSQCNRWVHQICALFNGRMNKGTTIYHCPFCFMARRGAKEPHAKPLGAKDIRHTKLSRFLEDRVIKSLEDAYPRNSSNDTHNSTASAIFVRQLSNIDKTHQVKPRLLHRYADRKYPSEFPVRSKCVLLFQEMDGVDVILFGMYLYEYGHNCPQPNQRRVYVSYLDSVYYFRPRRYRTLVYHEMLIAYLAHTKERGFHTAHIWACPPCKGDDYIFFCHPEDQKTPKDDRLRSWYITLLEKAKEEGIVTRITNLWDEHFQTDFDVTHIPYFEGDYWPGEAENVVKALEEEANERNESKSRKAGNSTKSKAKAKGRTQRGLRSDGSPEEENGQDALVARMGKILEPMKDAFIVAFLQPRNFARVMERRHEREQRLLFDTNLHNPNSTGSDCSEAKGGTLSPVSTSLPSNAPCHSETRLVVNDNKTKSDTGASILDSGKSRSLNKVCTSKVKSNLSAAKPYDETEDTDEIIESEFYDTRQQFLNLCQGNHYQFDDLRRAKHTSMMSLYHMHNPDVPKFLVTCSNCNVDINSGYCYTSEKDTEFHLCQDCYQKTHKIFTDKFPFRRSAVGSDSQAQLTEEQRRDRHRSIQLHMQLLQHASGCRNQQCPSANCNKMKNLLKHGATCVTRVQGGCAICRRIWALLQIHARQCRRDACMVPKCRQLKEQLRALAQQQAQMDERRRAAMNAAYRRDGSKATA